jgi:SAM-dependent methyltransferase
MKTTSLDLLRHPLTHEPLRLESADVLVGESTGDQFAIRDGIPDLLPAQDASGDNRKYQRLYDRIAWVYDLPQKVWGRLRYGGLDKVIAQYLQLVEVRPSDRVLEVSVGTGTNVWFLPSQGSYFGLDISWGMLRQCRHNAHRHARAIELVCGSAEHLPFGDCLFDVVYHVGGINFFNYRERAISEMVPPALIWNRTRLSRVFRPANF